VARLNPAVIPTNNDEGDQRHLIHETNAIRKGCQRKKSSSRTQPHGTTNERPLLCLPA
jgi:hypothetical protein